MKKKKSLLIYYFLFFFAVMSAYGADPYCQNLGFELGDFTNWKGYTWVLITNKDSILSKPKTSSLKRQTIMTDVNAYDTKTNRQLKIVPPGFKYSARLGDAVNGGLMESLSYKLQVDANNALLIYKFAVVLEDPISDHKKFEEPRFKVTLFDELGDTIKSCANYDVHASDARIFGFKTIAPSSNNPSTIVWRDWTAVGTNLSAYIGKTISIEFMAGDCTREAHYGYAYFVAECHPLNITVNYCKGDLNATLTAPQGFKYSWVDASGNEVGTNQNLLITKPEEGAAYTCNMTSETGCIVTLNAKTERYVPKANFTSSMIGCNTNMVQFTDSSTTTKGTLTYLWDFGDGNTSTAKNPIHTFSTSGMHKVTLGVSNPPSSCTDILQKEVESFSPQLIGINGLFNYCPNKTTTLKAYGANNYKWGKGKTVISTADSLVVGAPAAKIWMLGYSSSGCVIDTIVVNVQEEPEWSLSVDGRNAFCYNDSVQLTASGAASYRWDTGQATNSIYVKKPKVYTVTGLSPIGCEKSMSFNVDEVALPESNFIMLNPTVDVRHSTLKCFVVGPKPDVEYNWEMGDGGFETGTTIQHRYSGVLNADLQYKVTMKATNTTGCTTETTKSVEIVPFFPNVFTPNGDGINDLLMQGIEIFVYDRNGILLYNGNAGWDGKYKGKDMDSDTYFYIANYTDRNQQHQTKKGSVTLMR